MKSLLFQALLFVVPHKLLSKFKLSKQIIWEIRQNLILMDWVRSLVLYRSCSASSAHTSHLQVTLINNSWIRKSWFFFFSNMNKSAFCSEGGISNLSLVLSKEVLVSKSERTGCSSYVRELRVCELSSAPLFWDEGVFDGGTVLFWGWKRAAPRPRHVYLLSSLLCMLGKREK